MAENNKNTVLDGQEPGDGAAGVFCLLTAFNKP